jgi:DNA-directed RNA polymerase subunit M/transcription elongation factor TFIIS
MAAKNLLEQTALSCPNCESEEFMFSGLQKGYGLVPDMELWTCRRCHSTLSESSLRVKAGVVQAI